MAVHMRSLRKQLTGGQDKIPLDMECEGSAEVHNRQWTQDGSHMVSLGWFAAKIVKSAPYVDERGRKHKTSKHRVFLKCRKCGEWIPAGRLIQHDKRKDHQKGEF